MTTLLKPTQTPRRHRLPPAAQQRGGAISKEALGQLRPSLVLHSRFEVPQGTESLLVGRGVALTVCLQQSRGPARDPKDLGDCVALLLSADGARIDPPLAPLHRLGQCARFTIEPQRTGEVPITIYLLLRNEVIDMQVIPITVAGDRSDEPG